MKKVLFSLILILTIAVSVTAQFVRDKNGKIAPFSQSEEYMHLIDTSRVNTFVLPAYNNDSLYWEANFDLEYIKKDKGGEKVAFPIDTLIKLKEVSTKYKLSSGTVWLYIIESNTAERISIVLKDFDFPNGALLSTYSLYEIDATFRRPSSVYDKKRWKETNNSIKYWKVGTGNNLVIEYFEPNNISNGANIEIERIYYHYKDKKKSSLKTLPNHLKASIPTSTLKKVALEDDCQYDVVCSGIPDFKQESNAICYIDILYDDKNLGPRNKRATGFFLNKGGNYEETDRPYILTAGHSFSIPNSTVPIDFSNGYEFLDIFIKKQNKNCNSSYEYTFGTLMPNSSQFKVLKLGSSYNYKIDNPSYVANKDYAILQAPGMVKDYAAYNILYAGWASIVYYGQKNWVSIGHPNGEPQKVFVDEGEAIDGITYFGLFFDKGLSRKGTSGAPVFNYKRQVVGWICGGDLSNTCANVGTNLPKNMTKCGNLGEIHFEISQYIDPNFLYTASAYTAPIQNLPDHCKDCIQNAEKGETDIDCGGPCLPCGLNEKKKIQSMLDISRKVRVRYQLEVSPDDEELILKLGSYKFTAGEEILLKNGFVLKEGVDFKAKIDESLMSEPEQGCKKVCLYLANVFTPNGDGMNDVWGFNQAFMISYRVNIWDRDGKTWFNCGNRPVLDGNGFVPVWDGKGAPNAVYFGSINYVDCYGVERNKNFHLEIFGSSNKSSSLNNDKAQKTLSTELLSEDFNILSSLNVYPNPAYDKITIDYFLQEGNYEYTILNQSGKIIMQDCGNDKLELDLSDYTPGLYVLRIKVGKEYQVRKIIKK